MRKSLLFLLLLAVAAACMLGSAVCAMDARKDDIVVTQQTLYGDPALVEELSVTVTGHRDQQLFWKTAYGAGADPRAKTEFTFYSRQQPVLFDGDNGSFRLSFGGVNYGMGGNLDLEAMETGLDQNWRVFEDYMLLPAIHVAEQTPVGETRAQVVNLRDYYEYFRVGVDFHLDQMHSFYNGEREKALAEAINRYFRIPVPEELWICVEVTRDRTGEVCDVNSWQVPGPEFDPASGLGWEADDSFLLWNIWSSEVCTEDAVWFVLSGTGDFSQIEGGRGLYCLPIKNAGEEGQWLDMDAIEPVLPVPQEQTGELKLVKSLDETHLYLLTEAADGYSLTVFRFADRRIIRTIRLGALEAMPQVLQAEGVVVLRSGGEEERLQVFAEHGGDLTLWLDTPLYPFPMEDGWYADPTLLFDGDRLVLAAFRNNWNISSHRLLLYDRNGLQYAGDYNSTADLLKDRFVVESPGGMELKWN